MNLLKGVFIYFFLLPCALLIPASNSSVYRVLEDKSVLFQDLRKPLSYVPVEGVSPMIWLRYNPAFGAILWRNNAIDSLAFFVGSSAIERDSFPRVRDALNSFFKEIGFMHTTTQKNLKKRKMGILAGYLYLLQIGKITRMEFRAKIQKECKWAAEMNLDCLFDEHLFEKEEGFVLNSLVPALVSSYAFVIASQLSAEDASKTYLSTYRSDFHSVIAQLGAVEIEGYEISHSKNEAVDHGELFYDLFSLLVADFAANELPIGTELNFSCTVREATFANCAESTFINWLIGAHYNPTSMQLELTDRIDNDVIVDQLHGKCGFEASYNIQRITEQLENLTFVSYANLKRGKTIFKAEDQVEKLIGFIKVSSSKIDLIPDGKAANICGIDGIVIPSGNYFGGNYFVIDEGLVEGDFLYEICPEPLNFLVLAHHLGEASLRELFVAPCDLFLACRNNAYFVEAIYAEDRAMQCTKFKKFRDDFELEFPFGKMLMNSSHAVFKFHQDQHVINKNDFPIIEEDSMLFKIYNPQSSIYFPFESVFSAILGEKECLIDVTEEPLFLPIYCLLRKLFRMNYYQKLADYIDDKFKRWFKAFINPKFRSQNQPLASFLVGEFLFKEEGGIALIIEENLYSIPQEEKLTFFSILAIECGRNQHFEMADFDLFFNEIQGERIDLFAQMTEIACLNAAKIISQEIFTCDYDLQKTAKILGDFTRRFQASEEFVTNLWAKIQEKNDLIPLYVSALRKSCLEDKILFPTVLLAYLLRNNLQLSNEDYALIDSEMEKFQPIFNCFIRAQDLSSLKEAQISHPDSQFLRTLIESISNPKP